MKEKKLSLKQKKMLIIAGIILAVLLVVILVIRAVTGKGSGNGEDVLYADSVGVLTGTGLGTQNQFSGVVEAQDTLKLTLSDDQKVKEIFVEKGQEVEPGTKLYEFDTEELAMTLEQGNLELDKINNSISNLNKPDCGPDSGEKKCPGQ